MSITSITSGTLARLHPSGAAVAVASPVRQVSEAANEVPSNEASMQRHPLVAAMMAALKGLLPTGMTTMMPSATPVADAAAAATAAAATPAASPPSESSAPDTSTAAAADAGAAAAAPAANTPLPADLKQAASAFAHELVLALKGAASERQGTEPGRHRGRGQEHEHAHAHRHSRDDAAARSAYGDLAQRLEALAQKLTAVPQTPATEAAGSVAASAAPAAPIAAATPPDAPLLNAFKGLLSALNPPGAAASSAALSPDQKLATFLHQMAQALVPSTSANQLTSTGGLLNVAA